MVGHTFDDKPQHISKSIPLSSWRFGLSQFKCLGTKQNGNGAKYRWLCRRLVALSKCQNQFRLPGRFLFRRDGFWPRQPSNDGHRVPWTLCILEHRAGTIKRRSLVDQERPTQACSDLTVCGLFAWESRCEHVPIRTSLRATIAALRSWARSSDSLPAVSILPGSPRASFRSGCANSA